MKTKKSKKLNILETVFYAPSRGASKATIYIGLVLRTLVLYIGVLGLCALITGALGLASKNWYAAVSITSGTVALLSIPVSVASLVASLNRYTRWITPIVYVGGYFGITTLIFGNPISATITAALRIYNFGLYTLSGYGYMSLGNFMVSDGYDYSHATSVESDPHRILGVFLLCTLFGFILHFIIQRKAFIAPVALLCAIVIGPIITYNVARGVAGISFTLAFICGALALKVYDYRYGGTAEGKILRKKLRIQKKEEKAEIRLDKRDKKKVIANEAERIFDAAIESEMTVREARKAKNAYLKKMREEQRKAKKEEKKNKKLQKKEAKKNRKTKDKKAIIEADKESRKIRFCGGYAGVGVALVAFLAVLIPLSTVKTNFNTIDAINNKVQIAREYVTAVLKGDDVDLNELYAYGIDDLTPRQLTFDPIEYNNDRKLFRVESQSKYNVYLRSWIGTKFDYSTETWTSADHDEVLEYRERFGSDFTPDLITTDFYNYVFPSSSEIEGDYTYKNFAKSGFVEEQVYVWRVSGRSLLMFTPSHMNTDIGFTAYSKLSSPEYKTSKYFDGVYSSRFYRYGHGYGTVSFVPTYNRTDVGDGINDSIEYYKYCRDLILENKDEEDKDKIDYLLYQLDLTLEANEVNYTGTSIAERYFYDMTDEEKAEIIKSFETEANYRDYAYTNYTEAVDSETVRQLTADIQKEAEASVPEGCKVTTYDIIKTICDYFQSNYTYTLTPSKKNYDSTKKVLDSFLVDVKEGSSSHYTTAAVEILRTMGIPARYVEGLCTSEFIDSNIYGSPYYTEVYTSDSHSWVEVYEEGIGWVMYEVTPNSYMTDIYDPNAATVTIEELEAEDETPEDKFAGDSHESVQEILDRLGDTEVEEESDVEYVLARIIPFLIVLAVLGILFLIGRFFYNKANKAVDARFEAIDRARNEYVYNDKTIDNDKVIKKVNDIFMETLAVAKASPRNGETPTEFGERLYNEHPGWSTVDAREVLLAMEKAEFGHGLSYEETYLIGEYLHDMYLNVYKELSFFDKIKERFLRRKI